MPTDPRPPVRELMLRLYAPHQGVLRQEMDAGRRREGKMTELTLHSGDTGMTVRLRLCRIAVRPVGGRRGPGADAGGVRNSSSRPRGSEHGPKEDGMSAMVIYPSSDDRAHPAARGPGFTVARGLGGSAKGARWNALPVPLPEGNSRRRRRRRLSRLHRVERLRHRRHPPGAVAVSRAAGDDADRERPLG